MKYSWGKLTKHKLLSKSRSLTVSLPETFIMSKRSFIHAMGKYGTVIAKPSKGKGGTGLIKVTTASAGVYKVHRKKRVDKIIGLLPTYNFIRPYMKGTYLCQQAIELAEIKGRPFDVRAIVQRKKAKWYLTGTLAKIAGQGFFITNLVESKGKALPLSTAIRKSNIHGTSVARIEERVKQIALNTARQLQQYYNMNIVGIDLGIDKHGKVWIIEANLSPDKTYFLRLKDKSMYRRIMSLSAK